MDLAFPVHALAALGLAHQRGEAVLQHTGADAAEHVLAALSLQNDGVDALEVQELGKHEAGRAAADDGYLGAHGCLLGCVKGEMCTLVSRSSDDHIHP
ncbi:hypothetical protein D9M68_950530 [compost metagenome]